MGLYSCFSETKLKDDGTGVNKNVIKVPLRSRHHVKTSHFYYINRFQGNEKTSTKNADNDYSVKN